MACAGVALFTASGSLNGCAAADCNDTATCPVIGDDAPVTSDGFVDANNDDPTGIDSGDANDGTPLTPDATVDSPVDSTFETGDELINATETSGDVSEGGTGANDDSADGPPPESGMTDADAGGDALPDVGPPPAKCKANVLVPIGAVASSFNDPNVAAQAIDTNFTTRWESAWGTDPQWIYVDFGAPVFINRVQILWLRSCAANYDLQVSNSTGGWMTIRSITGNANGSSVSPTDWTTSVDHAGLAHVARYLRVFGKTRCDTNYGYSMWEIRVSGDTAANCIP